MEEVIEVNYRKPPDRLLEQIPNRRIRAFLERGTMEQDRVLLKLVMQGYTYQSAIDVMNHVKKLNGGSLREP